MAELDDLLEAAKRASRLDRISWRDPIAARGQRAIPRMREWLDDREFAAFAVRVLEKIGEQAAHRPAVIAALESVGPSGTSPAVDRDIARSPRAWSPPHRRTYSNCAAVVGILGRVGARETLPRRNGRHLHAGR
jgi:hypothetical protein